MSQLRPTNFYKIHYGSRRYLKHLFNLHCMLYRGRRTEVLFISMRGLTAYLSVGVLVFLLARRPYYCQERHERREREYRSHSGQAGARHERCSLRPPSQPPPPSQYTANLLRRHHSHYSGSPCPRTSHGVEGGQAQLPQLC